MKAIAYSVQELPEAKPGRLAKIRSAIKRGWKGYIALTKQELDEEDKIEMSAW
jgi:hypothetical protein